MMVRALAALQLRKRVANWGPPPRIGIHAKANVRMAGGPREVSWKDERDVDLW